MFGHYLVTFYRSLARRPGYAAINGLGLVLGIATYIVLGLFVRFQTGFEQWIPQASQVYIVTYTWRLPGDPTSSQNTSMGGLLDVLRTDYPQTQGARMWDATITVRQGGDVVSEKGEVVDPNLLSVLELPLVEGDRASALAAPDRVVITQRIARKYFGGGSALGKRLSLSVGGHWGDFVVGGVLQDPPRSTDLSFNMEVPLRPQLTDSQQGWRDWRSDDVTTYLRFANAGLAANYAANFDQFVDRHATADLGPDPSRKLHMSLAPLTSLHLAKPTDAASVGAAAVIGVLALLMAALNYANLASAVAALRARETAVRRVAGATTLQLTVQFMGEALATTGLAAIIGVVVAALALPFINAAAGVTLSINLLDPLGVVPQAVSAVLIVGLAAGAWPAIVLARFQPAAVLAASHTPSGGRIGARVRSALVVTQFVVAISIMTMTMVLFVQMRHLERADLGFRRAGLLTITSFGDEAVTEAQRAALLDEWRRQTGTVDVSFSDAAPADDQYYTGLRIFNPSAPSLQPTLALTKVAPGFFDTYGARLLAGRLLDPGRGDDSAGSASASKRNEINVVINRTAAQALGFRDPGTAVGRYVIWRKSNARLDIVGVISDMRFLSPRSPMLPTLYIQSLQGFPYAVAAVRFSGPDPRGAKAALQRIWQSVVPDDAFSAQTADADLAVYSRPEAALARLFGLGALISGMIGCVGLYGLASFSATRRSHEIGLRKTLGAGAADIVRLLSVQFLWPVVLAGLVALPIAFLAARLWLSGFDDRIALTPVYFLVGPLVAVIVATVTVAIHISRLARMDPAEALGRI